MAVRYRKYQDNSQNEKKHGKWYARAVVMGVKTTRDMADEIEANVSVKRADVVAVLAELSNVVKRNLQDGYRVVIDDMGSFKIGLTTKAAETSDKFTAENVIGTHVLFTPESFRTSDGHRQRRWLQEVKVQELPKNFVNDEQA